MDEASQQASTMPSNWMNATLKPTAISTDVLLPMRCFNFGRHPSVKYRSLNNAALAEQSCEFSSICDGRQQLARIVRSRLKSTQSTGPLMPQHINLRCALSHAARSSADERPMDFSNELRKASSKSALYKQATIPTASSTMKIIASKTANCSKESDNKAWLRMKQERMKLTTIRSVGDSFIAP